jgi:hypothetical protein
MRNALLLLVLVGCGGGSGVDNSKLIVDLSDSELDDLCGYILDEQNGTEECPDDFETIDDCVAYLTSYSDDCTATVRNEEECAEKLGDDPCSDPAACHASDDC